MSAEMESPVSGSFGYVEATASWATRYLDPSGFECLLSIQAESGSEVLNKAKVALSHLTRIPNVCPCIRKPTMGILSRMARVPAKP